MTLDKVTTYLLDELGEVRDLETVWVLEVQMTQEGLDLCHLIGRQSAVVRLLCMVTMMMMMMMMILLVHFIDQPTSHD